MCLYMMAIVETRNFIQKNQHNKPLLLKKCEWSYACKSDWLKYFQSSLVWLCEKTRFFEMQNIIKVFASFKNTKTYCFKLNWSRILTVIKSN